MTEGACGSMEFSVPSIETDSPLYSASPSVIRKAHDSSLPEGAFLTTSYRPIPTAFFLIGIAYIEPRHYEVNPI